MPRGGLVARPPFRAPHHTTSTIALVGGGSATLRPGEISLAHGGVLFLDELGEFAPAALDALREPLEEGVIRVSRAHVRAVLPARFLLVAATNPCPCGGGPPGWCECDDVARLRYAAAAVGPAARPVRPASRRAPAVGRRAARPGAGGEPSAVVAARVAARPRASPSSGRAASTPSCTATCSTSTPRSTSDALALLRAEIERGRLTGRGYHRIRRVARTIADLAGGPRRDGRRASSTSSRWRSRSRCAPACRPRRPGWWRDGSVAHGAPGGARRLRPDDGRAPAGAARPPRSGGGVRRGRRPDPPGTTRGSHAHAADRRPRGAGRRPSAARGVGGALRGLGIDAHVASDAAYPAALRGDPEPPAVLFSRGDLGALDGRRVGIVGTRNATTARPRHRRRARSGTRRRRRRRGVRAGQGHRRRGSSRCAGRRPDGRPVARRRQRAGPAVPAGARRACGPRSASGAAAVRVAAGHAARAVPVPDAQPHHRRPERGARRGREPRAWRLADHGPGRARALAST